ncbi:LexA family transcriptional regulator [Myxococcus sp. CA040A]|uniref:LexA family protein n=1 Tax=Myxococcus sp. CA040A TaxID=2741738 RepID=UPI00157AC0CD|nr:hypothetical protein [Myxococcus sp. CA040A]NTX08926.1 hypothetical protein [Myxococcus sp. CA040A]
MTDCYPRPPPEHGSSGGAPTSLQLAVLSFVVAFIGAHGEPPSVLELRARFGWKSVNGGADVLRRLAKRGLLTRRPGRHRSLRVTEAGESLAEPYLRAHPEVRHAAAALNPIHHHEESFHV